MVRQPKVTRFAVQVLLVLFSAAFVVPFVWLISPSLKPIEQTLSLPITFIPRAYYATIGGRRMEVTLDFAVTQPGAVVRYLSGDDAGKAGFLGAKQLAEAGASVQVIHPVAAGSWHITQRLGDRLGENAVSPVWDVVPRDQVDSHIKIRWANYPEALSALGGDA